MSATRVVLITAVLFVAGTMAIPVLAQQDRDDRDRAENNGNYRHDRDQRDDNQNYRNGAYTTESQNRAYQVGAADAQWDLQHGQKQHNRKWKNSHDAQAYSDGFNNTMNASSNTNANNHHHNRGWGNNGNGRYGNNDAYGNGNRGAYLQNPGAKMGDQDGAYTGNLDARNGEKSRATEWKGYKEADHGFSDSGMNKAEFQSSYRSAYISAYQRAYNQYRR